MCLEYAGVSANVAFLSMSSSHQPGMSSELQIPQLFAREHGGCPEGSIPVQRMDPNHARPLLKKARIPTSDSEAEDGSTHEYAETRVVPSAPNSFKQVGVS
jgi:hypothetical protein